MKVAIFTTETIHHCYFVRRLRELTDDLIVFCETEQGVFPFETRSSYEYDQENFEIEKWFDGKNTTLSKIVRTIEINSINEEVVANHLLNEKPEAVFVFGTGKIHKDIINCLPNRIYNLHGGDPEYYRGLDSHLWAIYHRDYSSLMTTLHHVDPELDTGDIIVQERLELYKDMSLHELRSVNTEACVNLALNAISTLKNNRKIPSVKQRMKGRYYSAMPAILKDLCKKRFENFSASISDD